MTIYLQQRAPTQAVRGPSQTRPTRVLTPRTGHDLEQVLISPILQKLRVGKSQVRRAGLLRGAYPMVPGALPVRLQRSRCAVNRSPGATWPVRNAKREGNAESSSSRVQGRKGRFRLCDHPRASSRTPTPAPKPLRRGRPVVPRGPRSGLARVCMGGRGVGDVRDPSTHPPPKLRQRNRESGAKLPERRGPYSQGVAGLEQFRGRGHRWRPPHFRTPGVPAAAERRRAWMSELRAARQGRGSVGAPDLSCSALGARPPEPQPQREPGSGQKAGSAAVAAAAREAPAPQAAGASLAAAAADTCWPGPRPIRGARGGDACGGGAGTPAGRPAGEAARARACAGAEGCPPGQFL